MPFDSLRGANLQIPQVHYSPVPGINRRQPLINTIQGLSAIADLAQKFSPLENAKKKLQLAQIGQQLSFLNHPGASAGYKYTANGSLVPKNASDIQMEQLRAYQLRDKAAKDALRNQSYDHFNGYHSIDEADKAQGGARMPVLPRAMPQIPVQVPSNPINDSSTNLFDTGNTKGIQNIQIPVDKPIAEVDTTPEEYYETSPDDETAEAA